MASLKYHILKEYANGVMDEKGRFFPFLSKAGTIAAKQGIRFYVKNVTLLVCNYGIHAAALTTSVASTVKSYPVTLGSVDAPITTADVPIVLSVPIECHVLCDMNTAVTVSSAGDSDKVCLVFAEVSEQEGEYGA